MGEGVNLQKHTSDIHHLDIPWEPASVQQRNGRGLRQGNKRQAVRIHTYLAKKSFDGYRYQTVAGKRNWMDQLWHGEDRVENPAAQQGTTSREDFLIMMADDPDAARAEFAKNKEAQLERYQAVKRTKAMGTFRQLVKAKQTHTALKDKETQTAGMLEQRIQRLKAELQADEHFPNKDLLDRDGQVMVSNGGLVFHSGATFQMEGVKAAPARVSQSPSTWTVTGMDPDQHEVTMRQIGYAGTGRYDSSETTFSLNDLESGLTPTDPVAQSEEFQHVIKTMKHPGSLKQFPAHLMQEHGSAIQARLHASMAEEPDYGEPERQQPLWAVRRVGEMPTKVFPGGKDAKSGQYTYILPHTPEMEKLIQQAYEEREQGKRTRAMYGSRSRRSRYSAGSTYYQNALGDFLHWEEKGKVLDAYGEQLKTRGPDSELKAASVPASRPVLLFFKGGLGSGFHGHAGREGRRGGSWSRRMVPDDGPESGEGRKDPGPKRDHRKEEVKKVFEEAGRGRDDTRTRDEVNRDRALTILKEQVQRKELKKDEIIPRYKALLEQFLVSERLKREELSRAEQAHDRGTDPEAPQRPLRKARVVLVVRGGTPHSPFRQYRLPLEVGCGLS